VTDDRALSWAASVEREAWRLRVRTTDWRRLASVDIAARQPVPVLRDTAPRLRGLDCGAAQSR
jgi:hypothetical protein